MALSATFTANFSSFYDAVDKAEAKLKDFGTGADKVGGRLNTLANQFSGRQVIQEATLMAKAVEEIGGVSKLTEKEIARLGATTAQAVAKMKALGMEVPANIQKIADETKGANKASSDWLGTLSGMAGAVGIAFSVGAITNFVGSVFDAAGAIKDQSQALGMGAEAFQRIKFAVEQGGGSIEGFTAAASKLNNNLGEGSKSTVAALEAAGLAFEAIRAMSPEEAFLSVSDAVGKIVDPMERARVAQDLFGKGAIELLPGMIEGYRELGASATVMSDETIDRLEAAGDAWEELGNIVLTATGGMIAAILDQEKKTGGAMAALAAGYAGTTAQVLQANDALVDSSKSMSSRVQQDEQRMGRAITEAAAAAANRTVRTQAQIEADKKAADAAEAHRKKIKELADAISGAGLAGQVADLLEAYKRLTPAQLANVDVMIRLADRAKALAAAGAPLPAQLQAIVDSSIALDQALAAEAEALFLVYEAEQARLFIAGKTVVGLKEYTAAQQAANAANAAEIAMRGGQIQATAAYNAELEHMAYLTSVAEAEQRQQTDATDAGTDATKDFEKSVGDLAAAFAQLAQISGGSLGDVAGDVAGMLGAMDVASKSAQTMRDGFANIQAGNIAQGAAQSAGGFVALAASFLQATEGAGKLRSTMTGAAMGFSVAGPWGAAVGAGIGLIRGFFNAHKEKKEVIKLRDDMIASAGGMEAFRKQAEEAGVSLEKFFGATKKKDLKVSVEEITTAFAALDEKKAITKMRDDMVLAAGGMEAFRERSAAAGVSLDTFFAARDKGELETAIGEISAAFQFQEEALQLVTDTAAKYGFTLEELGPAMQRQELDKKAQELYKDWEVLNSAGIDTIAITERMGESVSDYVQDAMAMGTEVPEAMRPMLEAMAKSGDLVDKNGDAVTDLEKSGLKFSMTMSQGFEKLITGVKELTDVISRSLGTAIRTVPPVEVEGRVSWRVDDIPAPRGPSATLPGYARGTDGFENFGAGTPVVLHGWEAVVPRDSGAMATVGGGAMSAGAAPAFGAAAPVTIVINAQGALFDTPGDLQRLAARVEDALSARHGLTNKRRAA